MKFSLQFFGGRGGSSHSGGGGGGGGSTKKADENRKGSASNPVKSSELNAMNEKERLAALDAMPVGTRIRTYNSYTRMSRSYVKGEQAWGMEFSPNKYSTNTVEDVVSPNILFATGERQRSSRFTSFRSVRYPKK